MQFPAPLDMQGDSHLFVTVSKRCLSCLHVSADSEEIIHLTIPVHRRLSQDRLDQILERSLHLWAREVFGCDQDSCSTSLCSEGECFGETTLIVPDEYSDDIRRSAVLGTDAVVWSDQTYIDASAKFLECFEASHLVWVVLDWDQIRVLSLSTVRTGSHAGHGLVREMKLGTEFLEKLPETVMPSLLTISLRRDVLIDLVSNLRERHTTCAGSLEVQDVLRAYITGALFSMKDRVLRTFGTATSNAALIISGDLAMAMPEQQIVLSVIDGLQLRGRYTLSVDSDGRTLPGAVALLNRQFMFPITAIYPRRYLYLSTEKGGSGRVGRSAFRGLLCRMGEEQEEDQERSLIGQTGQIYSCHLGGDGALLLEPARDVFFPNLDQVSYRGKRFLSAEYQHTTSDAIIDCRKIPVVYGPDAHANHRRVSEWLRGLPEPRGSARQTNLMHATS